MTDLDPKAIAAEVKIDLEAASPTPELPIAMGKPSEITMLEMHYLDAERGRTRNGRIALLLVVALLLVSLVCGVAISGWSKTTVALEARNKAVAGLTQQGIDQANVAARQNDVDICQDKALAAWFDEAIAAGEPEAGVLIVYYDTCEDTDGKTFRR